MENKVSGVITFALMYKHQIQLVLKVSLLHNKLDKFLNDLYSTVIGHVKL